mmetsp:Transcript_11033/g.28502  ORF Transcript_11033/g.28502 Transcript_11033/m.28502 type:complete len:396 (+) Transcript_11033:206-1393(+)
MVVATHREATQRGCTRNEGEHRADEADREAGSRRANIAPVCIQWPWRRGRGGRPRDAVEGRYEILGAATDAQARATVHARYLDPAWQLLDQVCDGLLQRRCFSRHRPARCVEIAPARECGHDRHLVGAGREDRVDLLGLLGGRPPAADFLLHSQQEGRSRVLVGRQCGDVHAWEREPHAYFRKGRGSGSGAGCRGACRRGGRCRGAVRRGGRCAGLRLCGAGGGGRCGSGGCGRGGGRCGGGGCGSGGGCCGCGGGGCVGGGCERRGRCAGITDLAREVALPCSIAGGAEDVGTEVVQIRDEVLAPITSEVAASAYRLRGGRGDGGRRRPRGRSGGCRRCCRYRADLARGVAESCGGAGGAEDGSAMVDEVTASRHYHFVWLMVASRSCRSHSCR